jgi:hypothetical protein
LKYIYQLFVGNQHITHYIAWGKVEFMSHFSPAAAAAAAKKVFIYLKSLRIPSGSNLPCMSGLFELCCCCK